MPMLILLPIISILNFIEQLQLNLQDSNLVLKKNINSKLKVNRQYYLITFVTFLLWNMNSQLIIERLFYAVYCLLLALNKKNEDISSSQQFQFTEQDVTEAYNRFFNVWQFIEDLLVDTQTFKS
ncbi:unnamed protein product [Paramecium octaurelia]|uniref:Uncharacterized protein n=1 Tax=Paramecium octaurelia TaxID=43137 RepID=A0A8S1WB47_PAROT|nr:unnamed protein product [Paramecium octaurelia]